MGEKRSREFFIDSNYIKFLFSNNSRNESTEFEFLFRDQWSINRFKQFNNKPIKCKCKHITIKNMEQRYKSRNTCFINNRFITNKEINSFKFKQQQQQQFIIFIARFSIFRWRRLLKHSKTFKSKFRQLWTKFKTPNWKLEQFKSKQQTNKFKSAKFKCKQPIKQWQLRKQSIPRIY